MDLGDTVSLEPIRRNAAAEVVGDKHKLASSEVTEFLNRAEQIGFVDSEGEGNDCLLFNGNLFKRDSVQKTARVLGSLSSAEQAKVQTVRELLETKGCVTFDAVEKELGVQLFEKLRAAGLYDINIVGNEVGEHVYVTSPAAFHKFVNPMVDDIFDMAKALVSALTYGITARSSSKGRITLPTVLISKLINGYEVGPATAIGADYRVLELNRVVALRRDTQHPARFHMRLLKREVVAEGGNACLNQGKANDVRVGPETLRLLAPEIETANGVLFNSYASDGERREQILNWMQRHQPCLFGRIAGKPFLPNVRCPLSEVREKLVGKDWTRYGGFFHSDHSIRLQFFNGGDPAPSKDITDSQYLQDFTYLYDDGAAEHQQFTAGEPVVQQELDERLGKRELWVTVAVDQSQRRTRGQTKKALSAALPDGKRGKRSLAREEVEALIGQGREWRLSSQEIEALERLLPGAR